MKIQKRFTNAARGMMAMKKDVAKDVMANLAENGTMFDKDKKTERKLNRISKKLDKQAGKIIDFEDKGTKRGDRKADKAYAKSRKLLAKGRAIKKGADGMKMGEKQVPNKPKKRLYDKEGKFIKKEDGTIVRNPDYREPAKQMMKRMQEGGKNPIAKDEDYTLMYQVDDQKMSGGRKIPETKVTGEEIKNLYQRNKIFPSEERYFQSQLKELGISEPIKNLVTTGRLESEIKKAKKSLAEKKSKKFKKEMMEQVNKPSQDRLKSGKKGMRYSKAEGGMKVQYKTMKDGGKNGDNQKVYSANEISKMSMKELAEIMNGIADSKSKNKDFKHKGMILGNTANTIKLIQDEVKMRMKNMTPEQMKKMMGGGMMEKRGEKGMEYKKGPGGMMISFIRKNK